LNLDVLDENYIAAITYKTAFLLAITTAKCVSELQEFSSHERYFIINQDGISLWLNAKFIPKVNIVKNREQRFLLPFVQSLILLWVKHFTGLCLR
jgi:hypothetical protein